MIDVQGEIQRAAGRKSDAASATGSVLARLSELLTNRVTAARAAFLDAAVSSIAAAATAVSNATWTAAKAAFLDAAVSSRLTTAINSVQDGSVNSNGGTTTISSVNTSKAVLFLRGSTLGESQANNLGWTGAKITAATTVTGEYGSSTTANSIPFTVVEFK